MTGRDGETAKSTICVPGLMSRAWTVLTFGTVQKQERARRGGALKGASQDRARSCGAQAASAPPVAAGGGRPRLRRLGLILAGAVLLTLSFQPFGQFYLAWVAMVPWLLAVHQAPSHRSGFFWGMLGGILFFGVNLWWMWTATIPGMIALILFISLHWGAAALVIRFLGCFRPHAAPTGRLWNAGPGSPLGHGLADLGASLLIAAVWVVAEWLRSHACGGQFCWLYLGHSQTPWPAVCQVADLLGCQGVSFLVMAVNAMIALCILHRDRRWSLLKPAAPLGVLMLAVLGYGMFRLSQDAAMPGPRILVVQPRHPYLRGGVPTLSDEQVVDIHLTMTRDALRTQSPDLVVWSENVMPPINREARAETQGRNPAVGEFFARTHQQLSDLASGAGAALVTGGYYLGGWRSAGGFREATDIRTTVYLYTRFGEQAERRYDKIQFVPFAEAVPFRDSVPWLHRLLLLFGTPAVNQQQLTPGHRDALTVFELPPPPAADAPATPSAASQPAGAAPWRFVTPICLEAIDSNLVARMFRPEHGPDRRADFLVNLSNDGWFARVEHDQHFQATLLRCIENRVPLVRCSNTGISGFVDSKGRVLEALAPGTSGTAIRRIMLDRRVTFYTLFGDVFIYACMAVSGALLGLRGIAAARAWWARPAPESSARRPSSGQRAGGH